MATVTLSEDNLRFILDSLIDRLENLVDLNTGDFGPAGQFDEDIKQAVEIMDAIEGAIF